MKLRTLALIATTTITGLLGCGHDEPAKDPSTTSASNTGTQSTATNQADGTTASPDPRRTADTQTTPGASTTGKTASPTGTTATTPTPATPPPANPPPANPPPNTQGAATHPPDNTGVNDRDRGSTATPMTQGNSSAEVSITAAIRRSVMSDSSLGFNAKNVKIITNGTRVVLRGPVSNEHERSAIETYAKQTAGVTAVDNQLEVTK